jgi:uncharacterized protein (TIGR00661 family)
MQILYGVVGEGMGHATRSRVIIEHLLASGHVVRVVVSGRAHRFLVEKLRDYPNATVHEIEGFALRYFGNRLDRSDSLYENLSRAPKSVARNIEVYASVAESGFSPELVISDFESFAALYGAAHDLPVVSIDNMQVIHRCRHPREVTRDSGFDFDLARWAVKIKLSGAYHYLVTSFFYPEVRKKHTTLVPPVLRPEILAAKREPGSHVLVYQTASSNEQLVPTLRKLPYRFRVYGMGRSGSEGNVTLCAFSETGFVDDLRTAQAVIAGGGFSLMSEAVSLHVPMLSVPVERQYEQELNARYLASLGYGAYARRLDVDVIESFLSKVGSFQAALSSYERRDNGMLFACLDELVLRAERREPRPVRLLAPGLGSYPED